MEATLNIPVENAIRDYLQSQEFKAELGKAVMSAISEVITYEKMSYATEEKLLNISDVMDMLSVTRQTVYQLRKSGKLPYTCIGSSVKMKKRDVEKLMNE